MLQVSVAQLNAKGLDWRDEARLVIYVIDADLDIDDRLGRQVRDCRRAHVLDPSGRRTQRQDQPFSPTRIEVWPLLVVRHDFDRISFGAPAARDHLETVNKKRKTARRHLLALSNRKLMRCEPARMSGQGIQVDEVYLRSVMCAQPAPNIKGIPVFLRVYADPNEESLKSLVDQRSAPSVAIKDGAQSISCPGAR